MVQILPFDGGAAAFLNGTIIHMTFKEMPPVVYTESAFGGRLFEDPAQVVQHQRAYDLVRAASLSSEASLDLGPWTLDLGPWTLDLIESTAKDHKSRDLLDLFGQRLLAEVFLQQR